jgi:hypothetical protein
MDSIALGTSTRSIIAHALKYPLTFFMELLRRLDTETKVLLREARLPHTFAPRAPDHCLSQDQKQLVVAADEQMIDERKKPAAVLVTVGIDVEWLIVGADRSGQARNSAARKGPD